MAGRLRQWQQANPEATFTDMENAVDAEMARLRRELLGELTAGAEPETPPVCPECGQSMVRNGR